MLLFSSNACPLRTKPYNRGAALLSTIAWHNAEVPILHFYSPMNPPMRLSLGLILCVSKADAGCPDPKVGSHVRGRFLDATI